MEKEQARQEGKPDAILEKIAMGKLNKFFKENTLLAQAYVKDGKVIRCGLLEECKRRIGPFTDFKHVELG